MNSTTEVKRVADALARWAGGISAAIERLSKDFSMLLEDNLDDNCNTGRSAMAGLNEIAQGFLERHTWAAGAGIFFAAAFVEKVGCTLEWWSRSESGDLKKLDFDLTPGSSRFYDYEKLPFFATVAATGEQTFWGPYLDYPGFEQYILSFTAPIYLHDSFIGVVGCDIRIKDLEPLLMHDLRAIRGNAALVNASDRVILGNSGRYLVGERLRYHSPGEYRMALDVPHLGLSLVYSTAS